MATIALSDISSVLKDVYEPGIKSQINQRAKLYVLVGKSARMKAGGTETVFNVKLSPNTDVISLPDGARLPDGGQTTTTKGTVGMRGHYGVFRLSQRAMYAAMDNEQAFVNLFELEADSLAKTIAQKFNRDMYGDGSGILCEVAANVSTSTTITCKAAPDGDLTGAATEEIGADGTRYLIPGQKIAIGTASTLAGNSGWTYRTVSSVTNRTSFVVNTSTTLTGITEGTPQYVVRCSGNSTTDGDNTEFGLNASGVYTEANQRVITGLKAIVDDGETARYLHGINHALWQSQYLDAAAITYDDITGAPNALVELTQDLIQQLFDAVDENASDDSEGVEWLCSHYSLTRQYTDLLRPDTRYAPQKLTGGYTKLTYAGGVREVPWFVDRDCTYNRLYAGGLDAIRIVEQRKAGFERKGGGVVKVIDRYDSIDARWVHYWNTACINRGRLGVIPNIRVTGLRQ